jgi:hypothetical protein
MKNNRWIYALACSLFYLFLAFLVGWLNSRFYIDSDNPLVSFFFPYAFIFGITDMVGWDFLAFLLLGLIFLVVTFVFYLLIRLLYWFK